MATDPGIVVRQNWRNTAWAMAAGVVSLPIIYGVDTDDWSYFGMVGMAVGGLASGFASQYLAAKVIQKRLRRASRDADNNH